MKTFGLIVCNIAIALGIWAGRGDYLREREDRRVLEARQREAAEAASSVGQPVAERGRVSRRAAPGAGSAVTDDMLVSQQGSEVSFDSGDATVVPRPRPVTEPAESVFAPSGRLKARFDEATDALARLDFEAAEKLATAMAEDPREGKGIVREKALQLAAKARAFRRVLSRVLSAPASPAAPRTRAVVADVLLANGSRFEGRLVEERPDRYVFKIATGGTFSPRREDVVELQRVEKEVSAGPDWSELQPKIAALEHPVDIFVDGVERCFRLGLKKEGLQVLERLLGRPDSDEVPLLFAADADASLLGDWQLAAGRKRPASGAPRPAAAAPLESETEAGSAIAARGADQESLLEAQRLVNEAQGLYQGAVGQEGKGDSLRKARDKLLAARQLLVELPQEEPAVKTLLRTIAQLTSDVARVSPF